MNNCGISGAVIFNVNAGTYNEQLNIASINGVSATNTVKFQSASGNNADVILTYAATGTPLAEAFLKGEFTPPRLSSVIEILKYAFNTTFFSAVT